MPTRKYTTASTDSNNDELPDSHYYSIASHLHQQHAVVFPPLTYTPPSPRLGASMYAAFMANQRSKICSGTISISSSNSWATQVHPNKVIPYYKDEAMNEDFIEDKTSFKFKLRCCVAEFTGCLLFIFIGSLSFIAAKQSGVAIPAFAHGLTIALLIIGLGHLSGGHFNPAVTLGIAISGEINPILAVLYVVSQLFGGFIGALLVKAVIDFPIYMWISGGTTNMNFAYATLGEAVVCEIVLTYVLVHTVLCAAVDSEGSNVLAALGIGLAVVVDILAGGNVSGASMNPARSLGPAIVYSFFYKSDSRSTVCKDLSKTVDPDVCGTKLEHVWANHWIHWVGPLLGAAIAAAMYKLFFAKKSKRWILK